MRIHLKMRVAAAAVFVAIVSLVLGDDASDCKHPPNVEKFASAYYTAQIVLTDPDVVQTVGLDGGEAAMAMYRELKNVLEEHRQCNANEAAFAGSHSLASVDNFTLPIYFNSVAYCIGIALNEFGLLDCDKAVSRALEYNEYVLKNFQGQDKKKLESYMHAAIYGWVDYFLSLGLKLKDFVIKSTNFYNKAVNEEFQKVTHTKKCKFDTSSD